MIPDIVHQVWIGTTPPHVAEWIDSVRCNSGLNYKLWTLDDLLLDFPDARKKYRLNNVHPAQQADIYRLLIIQRYGGVYLDADCTCLQQLQPLCNSGFFATLPGYATNTAPNNHFFGASRNHQIIESILASAETSTAIDIHWRIGFRLFGMMVMLNADETTTIISKKYSDKYITHHNLRSYVNA